MSIVDRQIALLRIFTFVNALRFGAPFLAIYFSGIAGSFALGMSVFSITSVAQIAAELPTGLFSDRVGRKATVVLGAALGLGFTLFYAIGAGYWFLAVAAALEGGSRAAFSGNNAALLHDTLAEEGREVEFPTYLGRIGAGEPLAFALASLVGGLIAAYSFHLAFWLTLVPQAVALGAALLLREPLVPRRAADAAGSHTWQAIRLFARNPRLRLLAAAAAMREGLGESSYQFRTTFFQTLWPTWALGIAPLISNLTSAASFYWSGGIIARVRAVRVLVGDILTGRAIGFVALLVPSVASPALMSAGSITYGATMVASGSLEQREFTERERATVGSIGAFLENIAFAVGALALGLLADQIGITRALIVAQALLLGAIPLYLRLFRRERAAE